MKYPIFILMLLIPALRVSAQVPPFFGGGAVAFDPEISVAQSGVLMDAQATVSADQKYVTLNMRASNPRLRSLTPVAVSTVGPQGFVGGVNLSGAGTSFSASSSPDEIQRQARGWIFARQGMYLVKPLP